MLTDDVFDFYVTNCFYCPVEKIFYWW